MSVCGVALCFLLGIIGINGKPPSAIVGGTNAIEGEFPYLVALKVLGELFCGGSIIDSRHILTAGHCVEDVPLNMIAAITVIVGTKDISSVHGNIYRIKSFKIHPLYAPIQAWKNDIAVLTLTEEIKFDERTKPIELPTNDDPGDVVAVASGWGDFHYPQGETTAKLRKLTMRVIPKGKCILPKNAKVHDSQLCAVQKRGFGLCSGDSGGPLVYDGKIIGIASYVYLCALGHADVFTRVYEYLEWIKNVTSEY